MMTYGGGQTARRNWRVIVVGLCLTVVASMAHAADAPMIGDLRVGSVVQSATLSRAIPFTAYIPRTAPSTGRLPALYLLHGHGDDERAWVDKGNIAAILDQQIAAGRLQPLIVIMPGAGNSWYVDDAQPGRYGAVAQAFTHDLIAGVEKQVPEIARCRQARAIGGHSMGGYGAMLYAVDRPDLFGAVISLSGSLFSANAADIDKRRSLYERIFGGVFGTPFDAQRFATWTVFHKLDAASSVRQRPPVWLAAGTRDFPSIIEGTRRMHATLQQRGIDSELSVIDGDHTWPLWQTAIVPALQWLSPKLSAACPAP